MAATKKTIMVGSLHEFSEFASNELIQTDKDAHDDPDTAPFFYFDATKQAFCAEINQDDKQAMRDFLARMAGYVELQQSALPALDEEPRIRPMQGTVIDDVIPEDIIDDLPLLRYESDSESSDGDALEPMKHLTTYWKPRNGRISILPPMYARAITESTGSSLFAEEAEKRYRIFQGDFQLALEKLLRLEPLLETFETQSGNSSHRATGNLLVWPPNQQDAKLEYVNVGSGHPSYHRVIVNRQEQTLSRKVLGELRTLDPRMRVLTVPDNLQYAEVQSTAECQASKIWNMQNYTSFGNPMNVEPLATSSTLPAINGDAGPVKDAADDKILAWTSNVVVSANPEIAPEAPVEQVAPSRRRVIVDSDSEDDETPTGGNKPASAATELLRPASLVQLSESEDLTDDEEQRALAPGPATSTMPLTNNDLLVDISDEFGNNKPQSYPTPAERKIDSEEVQIPAQLAAGASITYAKALVEGETPAAMEEEHQPTLQAPLAPRADTLAVVPEDPPTPPPARPTFNPDSYRSSPQAVRGRGARGGQRGQASNRNRRGDRGGKGQSNNRVTEPRPDSTPRRPTTRAGPRGARASPSTSPPTGRTSQNRQTQVRAPQYSSSSLVDLRESATTSESPSVPPGFESIVPLVPENVRRAPTIPPGFEFLAPQAPATSVAWGAETVPRNTTARSYKKSNATSGSSTSGRSRTSRYRFSDEGANYVTTSIPKVDPVAMRDKMIQEVMAAAAAREDINKKVEEEEPPKLHSTMRQQASNPGKTAGKNSLKKESAAEAAARRQRILEEAYGPTPVATPSRSSSPKVEGMSKWKKGQLKKQTPMAEAHPEIVGDNLRDQEAAKLVTLLQPIFETGRALKGNLAFEIQIGQVLVAPGQQMREKTFHSVDDWKSYFDSRGSGYTFSTFTRILTSNGADIDRALEMRGLGKGGNSKYWDSAPTLQSVQYEFQCQGRSNEDFQIIVNEQGAYELRKGQINVGTISIHVPAQIWDLSATLSGPLVWSDAPETVTQSVKTFCESLYVMPKRKLALYFRPPNDREIKIRNLIVKRVSYHPSNSQDSKNIFLKVTEAKNLQFRVHSEDKTLWMAYEPALRDKADYQLQLADAGRIHYELSVVHNGINDVLARNESLEVGELTDPETTGNSLLCCALVRSMLDTAIQFLSRIDYVGMGNYGTQRRLEEEEITRKAKLLEELGPRAKTLHATATSVARGSIMGASGMHPSMGNIASAATVVQPIPGVRMNTLAEIMTDESGNRYYYGMGGAKVPLSGAEEILDSAATVMPDDSASQAGRGPQYAIVRGSDRGQGFW